MNPDPEDPREHTVRIRSMLNDVIDHCREQVAKINEPKAQTLLETSTEVLRGLKTAYDHYLNDAEAAITPLTPPPKPSTYTDGESG